MMTTAPATVRRPLLMYEIQLGDYDPLIQMCGKQQSCDIIDVYIIFQERVWRLFPDTRDVAKRCLIMRVLFIRCVRSAEAGHALAPNRQLKLPYVLSSDNAYRLI